MLKEYFDWKRSRSVGAKIAKMLHAAAKGMGRKICGVFMQGADHGR